MLTKPNMRETLNSNEAISFINNLTESNTEINLANLIKTVCEKYSFISPNGKLQISSCNVVLNDLKKQCKIKLPDARVYQRKAEKTMRRLNTEIPLPENIPTHVDKLEAPLQIILIEEYDDQLKLIWNELMATEHPQGEQMPRVIR